MKRLFLELFEYLYCFLTKTIIGIMILPFFILIKIFRKESLIFNLKKWYFHEKKDEKKLSIANLGKKMKCYILWIKQEEILNSEEKNRIKIIKKYSKKEELNKREFYNILYASNLLGIIFCYFGYSRRKFLNVSYKFYNLVSKKYVLELEYLEKTMILYYFDKKINEKELLLFIKGIDKYGYKNDISFRCFIAQILNISFLKNLLIEVDTHILENFLSFKNSRAELTEEEKEFYLNHLFDYIFRMNLELDEIYKRQYFIKKFEKYTYNKILFLENKLKEVIHYECARDKYSLKKIAVYENDKRERVIINILLMLNLPINECLDKIPDEYIFRELKNNIKKEFLHCKLNEKLKHKEKDKIVKI